MFVFKSIKEPAADGLDLLVEFSTLGEYGFLPETKVPATDGIRSRTCEARKRPSIGRDSLDAVPRMQLIGALRTPRITPDWAA